MTFRSILFAEQPDHPSSSQPAFFVDLNLDQLVSAATTGREQYQLEAYYYERLRNLQLIHYRQDVVHDLQVSDLSAAIDRFAETMRAVRERLTQAGKLRYPYQQQSLVLAAAQLYVQAVSDLAADPALKQATSQGFRDLHTYLQEYVTSESFTAFVTEGRAVQDALAGLTYCLLIDGSRITVSRYDGQADYSVQVEDTFAKFKQGAVKDYRASIPDYLEMNHVEGQILDLVARLYPDTFAALTAFHTRYPSFIDETIALFDRQVQFYVGYLRVTGRLQANGLNFCRPNISEDSKNVNAIGTFDLVLADKLLDTEKRVVTNDFSLTGPERFFVVSGMNQGGKTTFARAFGQLHYLAGLGLPVPAVSADVYVPDEIFTHFEREEDPAALHGKLEDDLLRIHEVLDKATHHSIVIMNELFSSTTLADAITLGTLVLGELIERDCLGVCVTFVDELSRLGDATVSLVSAVNPADPAARTFKLERRPADGLSSALVLAEKYGLTYARLATEVG